MKSENDKKRYKKAKVKETNGQKKRANVPFTSINSVICLTEFS